MTTIRLTTAGESHGPREVCIIEGIPAGLSLTTSDVDVDLARRQKGYGRGGRMAIETDRCEFVAGVRLGLTIGSPIAILVNNKDHANWGAEMTAGAGSSGEGAPAKTEMIPRPGHADLAGMAKYGHTDIRPILERSSARETVARVAGGAVCRRLLMEYGVSIRGRVVGLGGVSSATADADYSHPESVDWDVVEASPVACDDTHAAQAMCEAIDSARERGESLGGVFEVWAWGLCPGIGSHVTFEGRLDGRLMGAFGSIPAVKGVEVGRAFCDSSLDGSKVHDALEVRADSGWRGVERLTNRAGGLEGGMTNGMPLVIRAAMKPIPTLMNPLPSVDLASMTAAPAHVERSDVTAVPAARVVGEAMMAYVLSSAYADKFGGDSVDEITKAFRAYTQELEERGLWRHS